MKICPSCKAFNRDEAKFCGYCRAAMDVVAPVGATESLPLCPLCGAENERVAKFCASCGGAIKGAGTPPTLTPSAPTIVLGSTLRHDLPPTPVAPPKVPEPVVEVPPDNSYQPRVWAIEEATPLPSVTAPLLVQASPPLPTTPPQSPLTCEGCGTVVQYCPCCGAPINIVHHPT